MKDLWEKINKNGGELLGFLLFTAGVVYVSGYIRFVFIPFALLCLFSLINNLLKEKSELIKRFNYLFGALCAGGVGLFVYLDFWNNDAVLIAKIGLLIFVGLFIAASIVFTIVSLRLIIKHLTTKG